MIENLTDDQVSTWLSVHVIPSASHEELALG